MNIIITTIIFMIIIITAIIHMAIIITNITYYHRLHDHFIMLRVDHHTSLALTFPLQLRRSIQFENRLLQSTWDRSIF